MINMNLQYFGGRGSGGGNSPLKNGGITRNEDGTLTLEKTRHGESWSYEGTAKLPAKSTYPMFKTYADADTYADTAYQKELENGVAISIFKAGSQRNGTIRYVVGMPNDLENKKLPKGYRWKEVEL